jgi:hypothetical protein
MAITKTRTSEPLGSYVIDKLVEVKPISRSGKWSALLTSDLPDEPYQYNKTKRTYTVPTSLSSRHLVQVLDNTTKMKTREYPDEELTEQEFFERRLDMDLNIYKKEDNFWRFDPNSKVIITKQGTSLNLNDPIEMIRYKILLSNKDKICSNWDKRFERSSYEFAIVDKKELVSKELEFARIIDEADDEFLKIKSNRSSMISFLKSTGKGVPSDVEDIWLKNEIRKIKETSAIDFLNYAKDPNLEIKVFIHDAIKTRALFKRKDRYFLTNGMELGDISKTINWLNDPENQDAKLNIKFQIEQTSK